MSLSRNRGSTSLQTQREASFELCVAVGEDVTPNGKQALAALRPASRLASVVTPACKLPVFHVIAEKGVGQAIYGGRTVCRGIVQG